MRALTVAALAACIAVAGCAVAAAALGSAAPAQKPRPFAYVSNFTIDSEEASQGNAIYWNEDGTVTSCGYGAYAECARFDVSTSPWTRVASMTLDASTIGYDAVAAGGYIYFKSTPYNNAGNMAVRRVRASDFQSAGTLILGNEEYWNDYGNYGDSDMYLAGGLSAGEDFLYVTTPYGENANGERIFQVDISKNSGNGTARNFKPVQRSFVWDNREDQYCEHGVVDGEALYASCYWSDSCGDALLVVKHALIDHPNPGNAPYSVPAQKAFDFKFVPYPNYKSDCVYASGPIVGTADSVIALTYHNDGYQVLSKYDKTSGVFTPKALNGLRYLGTSIFSLATLPNGDEVLHLAIYDVPAFIVRVDAKTLDLIDAQELPTGDPNADSPAFEYQTAAVVNPFDASQIVVGNTGYTGDDSSSYLLSLFQSERDASPAGANAVQETDKPATKLSTAQAAGIGIGVAAFVVLVVIVVVVIIAKKSGGAAAATTAAAAAPAEPTATATQA